MGMGHRVQEGGACLMPYTVRITDEQGRMIGLHTIPGLYFHAIRHVSADEIEVVLSEQPFQAMYRQEEGNA